MRELAADESLDIRDRETAVRAIGELHDSDSVPALLRLLRGPEQDLTFQHFLLFTIGEIGILRDRPALANIERHHPVEPVRADAMEARQKIEDRAALQADGGQ